MLSKIALYVLGIIAGGPINPYAIYKLINVKRRQTMGGIPAQTIYTIVKMLRDKKLISGKRIVKGNMPSRTVYSINKKGQDVLRKNLGLYLSKPEDTLSELPLAFFMMGHLDKDEVLNALREYIREVEGEIAIRTEMNDALRKKGVAPADIIAVEYILNILIVNLKTVNEIIEIIKTDPNWNHVPISFYRDEIL
jgi:DNA-binding PadR family transcriptional regulator